MDNKANYRATPSIDLVINTDVKVTQSIGLNSRPESKKETFGATVTNKKADSQNLKSLDASAQLEMGLNLLQEPSAQKKKYRLKEAGND